MNGFIKHYSMKLFSLFAIVILFLSPISTQIVAQNVITINPENEFQTFQGWGTSLSWWGNAIGGWQNTTKKKEILDLIFDDTIGLGMNVARYNIGGGDDPTHNHMRNGACLEGYQPSPGIWNYNADSTQRYILNEAIARGVNIVEGFSKTPPYWMTYSGCASGNVGGTSNLRPEFYDDYANYLAEVYLLFKNTYGITFDSISPINEPNGPWWVINNRQEGCYYEHSEQNELFKILRETFDSKGLSNVSIAGPEGFEFESTIASWNSYDDIAKSSINKINTHSYYGDERLYLHTIALCNDKRLSVSELGVGVGAHNHNNIKSALVLAQKIRDDIHDAKAETWVYWQAVEEEFYENNWGLIHANFEGEEQYEITKQYYGIGNFTKFIKPGSVIIGADNSNSLAALNKDTNTLTLVFINDNSFFSKYFSIDLSKFSSMANHAKVYRTSFYENLQKLDDLEIRNNSMQIHLAPRSITTFVIENAFSNEIPKFDRTKKYRIINRCNDKVMDIQNSSPENSANIIIMDKDDSSVSQGWYFIVNDIGEYYIANSNASKMLDVPGASTNNSVIMKLWQANGDDNQLWKITDLNNGYFSIINKNSNKALGIKNGNIVNGNNIDQYDFYSYDNQQWKFEVID